MILRTVPVPGRDGDLLRDIYSDEHGDIPVARRVHYRVADEIVARCNAYDALYGFTLNIATPCSEPLNSVCNYKDRASRIDMMSELRKAARMALVLSRNVAA